MRALILAAGRGRRLGDAGPPAPKCLLRFGGQSLLERHLAVLHHCGVDDVSITVGYEAQQVHSELGRLGVCGAVRTVHNPDYREGSVVSLWTLNASLIAGGPVLLLDADVLYDYRLMERLVDSSNDNCFLLDRDIGPGDEPVRLCVRAGRLVEFRKRAEVPCDFFGESVGFFKLSAPAARALGAAAQCYVQQGRRGEEYEEALREVLLQDGSLHFGFEDVTDLPWIEIDFPDDVRRAEAEILPSLLPLDASALPIAGHGR
jgi:choline kinase